MEEIKNTGNEGLSCITNLGDYEEFPILEHGRIFSSLQNQNILKKKTFISFFFFFNG